MLHVCIEEAYGIAAGRHNEVFVRASVEDKYGVLQDTKNTPCVLSKLQRESKEEYRDEWHWDHSMSLPFGEGKTFVLEIIEKGAKKRRFSLSGAKVHAKLKLNLLETESGKNHRQWYQMQKDCWIKFSWSTLGEDGFAYINDEDYDALTKAAAAALDANNNLLKKRDFKKPQRLSVNGVSEKYLLVDESKTLPIPSALDISEVDHYKRKEPNELLILLVRAKVPIMDISHFSDQANTRTTKNGSIKKGSTDPYFTFDVDGSKYKSKVKPKELNPIYMEKIALEAIDGSKSLTINCYDQDTYSRDDFIGTLTIPLANLNDKRRVRQVFVMPGPISDQEPAEVELVLAWRTNPRLEIQLPDAVQKDDKDPEITDDTIHTLPSGPNELTVVAIRAKHLLAKDVGGTSDPYVRIMVDCYEERTQVKPKTTRPVWLETFRFNVEQSCNITFDVYDHDQYSQNDFIGRCTFAVKEMTRKEGSRTWQPLTNKKGDIDSDRGDIEIYVAWRFSKACHFEIPPDILHGDAQQPLYQDLSPNELIIYLIRARALTAMDMNITGQGKATSDPYVIFKADGQVAQSTVKWKSLNPQWREAFRLPGVDNNLRTLECQVFDRDLISGDDLIGEIYLPLSEIESKGPHRAWYDLKLPKKSTKRAQESRGLIELFCAWRHNPLYAYTIPQSVLEYHERPISDIEEDHTPNELVAYIIRAKGLQAKDAGFFSSKTKNSADPFLSIHLLGSDGKAIIDKNGPSAKLYDASFCKTSVQKQELNPVWLEEKHIWTPPGATDVNVVIESWNAMSSPSFIGHCEVKLNALTAIGHRDWYQIGSSSSSSATRDSLASLTDDDDSEAGMPTQKQARVRKMPSFGGSVIQKKQFLRKKSSRQDHDPLTPLTDDDESETALVAQKHSSIKKLPSFGGSLIQKHFFRKKSSLQDHDIVGEVELWLAYRYNHELAVAMLPEENEVDHHIENPANELQIVLVRGQFDFLDVTATENLYVTISVGTMCQQSRVRRGISPLWKEKFLLHGVDDPDDIVEVRLHHQDSNSIIGGFDFRLDNSYRKPVRKWHDFISPIHPNAVDLIVHWRHNPMATELPVLVDLRKTPSCGTTIHDDGRHPQNCLQVAVLKARRLSGLLHDYDLKKLAPVFSIRVPPGPERKTIMSRGRHPAVEEAFIFWDVDNADADYLDVVVEHVAGTSRNGSNHMLGTCRIPMKLLHNKRDMLRQWFDLALPDGEFRPRGLLHPDDEVPPAKVELALRWSHDENLHADIGDFLKSTKHDNSSARRGKMAPNELRLILIRARHMIPRKRASYYVRVACGGNELTSKAVKCPHAGPRWLEELLFEADDLNDVIDLQIYECMYGKAERRLGAICIENIFTEKTTLARGRPLRRWYDLRSDAGEYRGQIELAFLWIFNPDRVFPIDSTQLAELYPEKAANCIKLILVRGRKLFYGNVKHQEVDHDKDEDIYSSSTHQALQVTFTTDDSDAIQRSTSQNGPHPIWNETFSFGDIEEASAIIRFRLEVVNLHRPNDTIYEYRIKAIDFRDREIRRFWIPISTRNDHDGKLEVCARWMHDSTLAIPVEEENFVDEFSTQDPNELSIVVVRARRLTAMDEPNLLSGLPPSSDPYVRLECSGIAKWTKVVKRNLSPIYMERFQFEAHEVSECVLLEVFDSGASHKEIIGATSFKLSDFASRAPRRQWFDIMIEDTDGKESLQGQVELLVWWHHEPRRVFDLDLPDDPWPDGPANQLIVCLIRARNIPVGDKRRNICNPFATLEIERPKSKRKRNGIEDYKGTDFSKLVEQSTVVRHDRWPAWIQTFQFPIQPPPIDDHEIDVLEDDAYPTLKVSLTHSDDMRGGKDIPLGSTTILLDEHLASKTLQRGWYRLDRAGFIELALRWQTCTRTYRATLQSPESKRLSTSSAVQRKMTDDSLPQHAFSPSSRHCTSLLSIESDSPLPNELCIEVQSSHGLYAALSVGTQCHINLTVLKNTQRTSAKTVNHSEIQLWKERFTFSLQDMYATSSLDLKCEVINSVRNVFSVAVCTATLRLDCSTTIPKRERLLLGDSSNKSIELWLNFRERAKDLQKLSPSHSPASMTNTIGRTSFIFHPLHFRSPMLKMVSALRLLISVVSNFSLDEKHSEIKVRVQDGRAQFDHDDHWHFETSSDASIQINVIGRFLPKRKHESERGIGFAVFCLNQIRANSTVATVSLSGGACSDDCDLDRGELEFSIRVHENLPEEISTKAILVSDVVKRVPRIPPLTYGPLVLPATFSFAGSSTKKVEESLAGLSFKKDGASTSAQRATWLIQRKMIEAAAYQVGERHRYQARLR